MSYPNASTLALAQACHLAETLQRQSLKVPTAGRLAEAARLGLARILVVRAQMGRLPSA